MIKNIKVILKILLIGVIATFSRIVGQLLIPAGEQTVLPPSVFAINGTLPLVFTLYGILAYSVIAAMFLLVRNQLTGNKIWQGLKYGVAYSLVWIAYLLEPLPHAAPLDRITYPLADSFSLLVLGILAGLMFGKKDKNITSKEVKNNNMTPIVAITVMFISGRFIQYYIIDIYSSFSEKPFETVTWCIVTGLIISYVMVWLNDLVQQDRKIPNALIVGGLLFGLNLLLFNFFIPLVLAADMTDLILRTALDIVSVTIGCLSFKTTTKVSKANSILQGENINS